MAHVRMDAHRTSLGHSPRQRTNANCSTPIGVSPVPSWISPIVRDSSTTTRQKVVRPGVAWKQADSRRFATAERTVRNYVGKLGGNSAAFRG